MVYTFYGPLHLLSSSSPIPPDNSRQLALFVSDDYRTGDEMVELVENEFRTKGHYLPTIKTFILSMHERYWTADFVRSVERCLPPSVNRTVVKLVRPNKLEISLGFCSGRGALDGINRGADDPAMPLSVDVTLVITLDTLVELKDYVLRFVEATTELESLTILPSLVPGGSRSIYLDAVIQVLTILSSSVSVHISSALQWTREDAEEIGFVLSRRRL